MLSFYYHGDYSLPLGAQLPFKVLIPNFILFVMLILILCLSFLGKISTWIDLDSENAELRRDSEDALKAEIAWASHLSLQVIVQIFCLIDLFKHQIHACTRISPSSGWAILFFNVGLGLQNDLHLEARLLIGLMTDAICRNYVYQTEFVTH